MMTVTEKIKALSHLGNLITGYYQHLTLTKHIKTRFQEKISEALVDNHWFTDFFIQTSLQNIAYYYLSPEKLTRWLSLQNIENTIVEKPKNIGIITAGNIPLVGFYDFVALFFTPHKIIIQPSRRDKALWLLMISLLSDIDFRIAKQVTIDSINEATIDIVIATGGQNTQRYFVEKFGKKQHLFRTNRTSVAILSGQESTEDLKKLSQDILLYFGLGCRNVSKIFVPKNYDFSLIINVLSSFDNLLKHQIYQDTLRYHIANFELSQTSYFETSTVLLTENHQLHSLVGTIYYQYYQHFDEIFDTLPVNEIQCIVSQIPDIFHHYPSQTTPLGTSQTPTLENYPDGINLFDFL